MLGKVKKIKIQLTIIIVTLQNWIQPYIVGLTGGGSKRGTEVDRVRQIMTAVMMDKQDQTLCEDQRK